MPICISERAVAYGELDDKLPGIAPKSPRACVSALCVWVRVRVCVRDDDDYARACFSVFYRNR